MEKGFLLAAAKILEADDDESEITLPVNSNILFNLYYYSLLLSLLSTPLGFFFLLLFFMNGVGLLKVRKIIPVFFFFFQMER
jgi:hypothetical protein